MNWRYLRDCFKGSEQVLAAHLLLFRFVYPHAHRQVPRWILTDLLRTGRHRRVRDPRLCNGPLLSRAQYLVDIASWGYVDARLPPYGRMTPRERADLRSSLVGQHRIRDRTRGRPRHPRRDWGADEAVDGGGAEAGEGAVNG
jgi:hypothetical protein